MATLEEFRQQYPQYDDMSDGQLALSLYRRHYSDLPVSDYVERLGLSERLTPMTQGLIRNLQNDQGEDYQNAVFEMIEADLTPSVASDVVSQVADRIPRGLAGAAGLPVDMWNLAGQGVQAIDQNIVGLPGVEGEEYQPVETMSSPWIEGQVVDPLIGPRREARTDAGRIAGTAAEFGVGGAAFGPVGGAAGTAARTGVLGGAGLLGGGVAETTGEPLLGMAAETLAGGGGLRRLAGTPGEPLSAASRRGLGDGPDSIESLRQRAGDLYEEAARTGTPATQAETQTLASQIRQLLDTEGAITPTGRINSTYTNLAEAISTLDDYARGSMSIPQMQAVRRVLQDAAGSANANERRIGTAALRQFDEWTDSFAPQFAEARDLWRRASLGDQVRTTSELAETRVPQFSQSGPDNAYRTEFRNLERNIVRGNERGIPPDVSAAISRVARGSPAQNTLRVAGRMAPGGILTHGNVLPAVLGSGTAAAGAPLAGGLLTAGLYGTGIAARSGASRIARRNALIAQLRAQGVPVSENASLEELMRYAPGFPGLLGMAGVEALAGEE